MKNLFFYLTCLVICSTSLLQAQNPNPDWASVKFPKILITEYRCELPWNSYLEITNTEDSTVDLSSFRLVATHWGVYNAFNPEERWFSLNLTRGSMDLSGYSLEAGESMVFGAVYDKAASATTPTIGLSNPDLTAKLDVPIFVQDVTDPEIPFMNEPENLTYDFDSISSNADWVRMFESRRGAGAYGLWYKYEHTDSIGGLVTDSLMVDNINMWLSVPETGTYGGVSNVAGVQEATSTHTLIRKFDSNSSTDWDISRGITGDDSYWMPVTNATGNAIYTTLGNHGNYSIDLKAKTNTVAEVSDAEKTITVPWEAVRGDSVRVNYLEMGDGMAWLYVKDSTNSEDSAFVRVMDGDLFTVYAFGKVATSETYTFKVLEPTADLAIAFSKTRLRDNAWGNTPVFNVTSKVPMMDSITGLPDQYRIDSLLHYIEVPPMATREIIFIDNNSERIDLMDGDLLRVTSENKEVVKDYYLVVNEYATSDDVTLSSITWPDYDKDYFFEWEYLQGDTLPDFTTGTKNYKLVLPDHYVNVPALCASATDLNSQVTIKRAVNLTGTLEERTTTFTVVSESDTLEDVYSVVFELDLGDAIQLTDADPFISEHLGMRSNADQYTEFFNPNNGTEALDLSHYMLVRTRNTTLMDAAINNFVPASPTDKLNQTFYIPGYKFNYNKGDSEDYDDWTWKDDIVGGITPDANVKATVAPGDVFVVGNWDPDETKYEYKIGDKLVADIADLNLRDNPDYPNSISLDDITSFKSFYAYYLFEILNDSILEGTKGIWGNFEDFRIVDALVRSGDMGGTITPAAQSVCYRKSYVQHGNIIPGGEGGAFHADYDTCEFYHFGRLPTYPEEFKMTGTEMGQFIGYHNMDPITSHMSTVTSNAYKVDLGFEGDLKIKGEMTNVTVANFISNLAKPDTAQMISVKRGDDIQPDNVVVMTGDSVVVMSADSVNTTKYTISAAALNSDVSLTAVDGLGIIVNDLTISGFGYDKAIADVLAGVECNDLSYINIIDEDDHLVPLITRSQDTSLVEPLVSTMVFNGVSFEVVAEDGSKAKYTLTPDVTADEAYLTSNVFTVNQEDEYKSISGVTVGYSVPTFLNYLIASGNATLDVKDKTGVSRTYGMIQTDDYVSVTSEDASTVVNYSINYLGEQNPNHPDGIKAQNVNPLINIYPNPTTSLLNIENVKLGSVIQMISLNGSMVYTNGVNNSHCTIDMSQMNSGIYIVRVVEKEGSSVFKILKK